MCPSVLGLKAGSGQVYVGPSLNVYPERVIDCYKQCYNLPRSNNTHT